MEEQYKVSARKYRPQKFEEVVGQEHVTTTLKNAITSNQLAQAFLFCGPRGVGKTTCARILAKVINAPEPAKAVQDGSYADMDLEIALNIFELDAASNNSVDDIRNLVEQVRFAPQSGKYKVYIIDEVHMLSQQAFNAFLKTLEEPPPYAIFILATTEKHKILPTILSRCQIFNFRQIRVSDIVNHLQKICEQEGIEAEEAALHLIAQKADGALRDALSIFDQIASFSNKKIEYNNVLDSLNVLDYDYYFKITNALLIQDEVESMVLLDEIIKKGFDGGLFLGGLSQHFRDLLFAQSARTTDILDYSEQIRERYAQQATIAPAGFLLSGLNICNQFAMNYKTSQNKRLQIELALLKLAYLPAALKLSQQPVRATNSEKKTSEPVSGKKIEPQPVVKPKVEEDLPGQQKMNLDGQSNQVAEVTNVSQVTQTPPPVSNEQDIVLEKPMVTPEKVITPPQENKEISITPPQEKEEPSTTIETKETVITVESKENSAPIKTTKTKATKTAKNTGNDISGIQVPKKNTTSTSSSSKSPSLFSFSLEEIEEDVRIEDANAVSYETTSEAGLTPEKLIEEWQKFGLNQETNRAKEAFKNNLPNLQHNEIIVEVGNVLDAPLIKKTGAKLIKVLKEVYHLKELNLTVHKIEVAEDNSKPKSLSPDDRIKEMMTVNPAFADFVKRFQLEVDY